MIYQILHKFYFCFWEYLAVILTIATSAVIFKLIVDNRRLIELANKLPGPRAFPIFGNALMFACKSEKLLDRIVHVITPYINLTPIRLWMGPMLYIVIAEPRDIEVILNSQKAATKGSPYKFLYPFIGNGLISGSGKLWKSHRKMVLHIVNQRTLNAFIKTFNRRSDELIEKLETMANGKTFDILSFIEGCTINIVSETVMGCSDINALNNPNHEFLHHTAEMYKIIHNRMMKVWLHPDWIFKMTSDYNKQQQAQKVINTFTEKCIEARKQEIKQGIAGVSLLEKLLLLNDEIKELNDSELRDEIYTIYIASQDTLAVTISFALLMLGIHKDVQDKTRNEVDEILRDGDVDIAALAKLKYLEMLIKETLRLFPIAPLLVRQINDDLKLENCILPRGCEVVVLSYVTHRNSKYWKIPNEFIPERFVADEMSKRNPYTFIPFSGGPMGCIGQKYATMALKTILAKVLQKYIIYSDLDISKVTLKTDISIRSVDGYRVSLRCREKIKNE